jgi:hypothetical protein
MSSCPADLGIKMHTFVRDSSAAAIAGKRRMGKSALMDEVADALAGMQACNIIRIDRRFCDETGTHEPAKLAESIASALDPGVRNYVLVVDADAVPGWESVAESMSESAEFFYSMELCHQVPACARFVSLGALKEHGTMTADE